MVSVPIDIRPAHLQDVQKILATHLPLEAQVWVFGSRASYTSKDSSDLDLALQGKKKLGLDLLHKLELAFEESSLPYTVDVLDLRAINGPFKQIVEEQKVPLPGWGEEKAKIKRKLPEGWREVKLGEVATSSYGYTASANFEEVGPKLLRITDIQGGIVNWKQVPFCEIEENLFKKYHIQKGDILVARTGASTGENYLFTEDINAVYASYLICFRTKKNIAEPKFIWYTMRSSKWWEFTSRVKTGSAQPGANAKVIGTYNFPLPPLPEQRAIGEVLSALDDKIEINRQMCQTLEEMASALFQSWFVDFEPVKAKAAGKKPEGLAADIAALFPDSFMDSEMGKIPKGWGVEAIDKIGEFLNGLALQKYPAKDSDPYLPVIKIAEINRGITKQTDKARVDIGKKYIVDDGDVIFSWSGSLKIILWPYGKGALNQHLFKVTSSEYPKWFYYFWIKQHMSFYKMIAASKVTTMGHIKRGHLRETKAFIPNIELIKIADKVFSPIIQKIIYTNLQIRSLTQARDTLLPKLNSGELRVEKRKI